MSSANPRITQVRAAIIDWLRQESAAGNITPGIRDYPPFIRVETHKQYPALVVRCKQEAGKFKGAQRYAELLLVAVLDDPKDDRATDDIEGFANQIIASLYRKSRYASAQLEEDFRIRYDDRKKGEGSLMYAEIHIDAIYHGGN